MANDSESNLFRPVTALAKAEDLSLASWYQPTWTRPEAEEFLKFAPRGAFVIRIVESEYALAVQCFDSKAPVSAPVSRKNSAVESSAAARTASPPPPPLGLPLPPVRIAHARLAIFEHEDKMFINFFGTPFYFEHLYDLVLHCESTSFVFAAISATNKITLSREATTAHAAWCAKQRTIAKAQAAIDAVLNFGGPKPTRLSKPDLPGNVKIL